MMSATSVAKQDMFSPSLIATIGFEIEVSGFRVYPFFPKGTVLLQADGWCLETDWMANTDHADIEFVFSPMSSMKQVEKAADEIVALMKTLLEKARQHPQRRVNLEDVCENCLQPCTLVLRGTNFVGRMQPTYGIALKDMKKALRLHYGRFVEVNVHKATSQVVKYYNQKNTQPLTQSAHGFIQLILLYLNRARGGHKPYLMPKIDFNMMTRSDFCSIYDKLLDDNDRAQVRTLLLASGDGELPGLMQALSMQSDRLVFRNTYFSHAYEKVPGPTVQDWLSSIIYGRPDCEWKKDLMSPPPGLRIHTGNTDDDFGMGSMGVDEVNKLVLFEIRAGKYDGIDVIMSDADVIEADFKYILTREYSHARRFNPRLEPINNARYASLFFVFALQRTRRYLQKIGGQISKFCKSRTLRKSFT